VAGVRYVIEAEFSNKGASDVTKCTTTIWDRPWLPNGREIVFNCDENKKYTINKQNERKKRSVSDKSGDCVGCPRDTTAAEAAEVEDMVHEALVQLKGQADGAELVLKKVISTKKQVVAGYRYTIVGEFGNKGATDVFQCKVTIWDRPWLPDGRETNFDCDANKKYSVNKQKQRRKRSPDDKKKPQCVGCPVGTDASENEEIVKLVNEEVVKLNAQEANVDVSLSRVISSTQQVVAGIKYVINAEFISKNGKETFKCKVIIWERVWLPNGRETKFECDGKSSSQIL
jgi:Cystatin domain